MSKNYTFESLNDKEFEILAIDLLKQKLQTSIERFKAGKDLGIDGRFFDIANGKVIIQCKHYLKSGVSKLIFDLKKKELPKIQRLQPTRYIVATTCPLSPIDKQKIKQNLYPYILSEADILGQEDLNSLLDDYPKIERNHFKLWFSSTNILHTLLNNALLGRSREYFQNSILKNAKLLVETDHYPKSLELIQKNHTVIITGAPGVGKTTLANQISLHFCLNEEYEFYCIDEDLKEAEDIFQEGKKQLFYFDDFLGSNILEALNTNNRDSKVLKFIERVKNNSDKRFILTSRAHILNQKISLNERYNHANINKDRYELEIAQLSDLDKAKIFYNHIWHSTLPKEYIDVIYFEERYKYVIKHRNYNPRIIEFITKYDQITVVHRDNYWTYIQNTLDNPEKIWNQVIDNDIDEITKHLLLAITLNKNKISEEQLQKFYNLLLENHPELHNKKNYKNIIEPLLDSLLQYSIERNGERHYSLFNPSIADYFLNNYLSEYIYISKINLYLNIHKYAAYLNELHTNQNSPFFIQKGTKNIFPTLIYNTIINEKIIQFHSEKTIRDIDYELYYLKKNWSAININKLEIQIYLNNLRDLLFENIEKYEDFRLLSTVLNLIQAQIIEPLKHKDQLQLIINFFLHNFIEHSTFILLSKIIKQCPQNQFNNIQKFKEKFIDYLLEDNLVHEYAYDDDIFSGIDSIEDCQSYIIKDWITKTLLSDIPFEFNKHELETLEKSIDIYDIFEKSRSDNSRNDSKLVLNNEKYKTIFDIDPITDLFEKS